MDTLHLVAADHREAATLFPMFDIEVQTVDEIREALLGGYGHKYGPPDEVGKEEVSIASGSDAPAVRALLFRPTGGAARGALLHMHGGGWLGGKAGMMASLCAGIADRHNILVLSVDYRLTPDAPGDAALDDCFTAFKWLSEAADRLGFEADRIAVMGDSAGANLAAGVALLARDAGMPLAAQLLIYPALDDRTGGPDSAYENHYAGEFVLSQKYLHQLWQVRLADAAPDKLAYLAPARTEDLARLAPAFIAVGSIDVVVDESIDYAARLGRAGVPVDLRVYSGVYHAFDLVAGATTDRYNADLAGAIEAYLG